MDKKRLLSEMGIIHIGLIIVLGGMLFAKWTNTVAAASGATPLAPGLVLSQQTDETDPAKEAAGSRHIIHEGHAPTFLFVLSSEGGAFANDTISLTDVSSRVTYFSDRPNLIAGHMSMDEFLEMWNSGNDSFKKDPPNAALSVVSANGTGVPIIEIFDPKLSGDTLTFKTRVISGEVPASMGPVSVFVDTVVVARRGYRGAAVAVRGPYGGGAVAWRRY